MTLYEITTGTTGISYQRCYIWSPTEEVARELFASKYPKAELRDIIELFNENDTTFITNLSTEGFDTDDLL